jgi:hypothetical protein
LSAIEFCDRAGLSRSAALLLSWSEKFITFRDRELAENETIHSVVIGYVADGMRVFLIINRRVKFTDVYLPPMRCPVPLVIVAAELTQSLSCYDSPLIDLSSVIWPWQATAERDTPPIAVHLPVTNAKFSDFFFQLCQALDDAPMQALLDLGTAVQSPGTAAPIPIDTVLSQLTDDMFVDGFPVNSSPCASRLRAYQGFGTLIGSYALSGKPFPVNLDESVVAFAFDVTKESNPEIALQLGAIRVGVYKIELVKPSLRRFAHRPQFCRSCLLRASRHIEITGESRTEHAAFLMSHFFLMPFLRNLLRQHFVSDSVKPVNVEFVDEMEIGFVKERNAFVLPGFQTWIKCFARI